jgi:hypothetical protein
MTPSHRRRRRRRLSRLPLNLQHPITILKTTPKPQLHPPLPTPTPIRSSNQVQT